MSRSDVIILGGGLVGLALAAALDASGLTAAVVDPADPDSWKDASFDGRTSAVSSSSRRMFDAIGLMPLPDRAGLPDPHHPRRRRARPRRAGVRAARGRRRAIGLDAREPPFARRAPRPRRGGRTHSPALEIESRRRSSAASMASPSASTAAKHSPRALLVAAEGRNSPTREAAGIRVARWQYDHAAIVSTLRHERPHDHVA